MKYKRVFFVGFFANSKDKLNFTTLFNCDKKIFLESSENFKKVNSNIIKYFPMNLFHMQGRNVWKILFKSIEVDKTFIHLYKRDLKIFKRIYISKPMPNSIMSYGLFIYWVFRNTFKSRFSFVKCLDVWNRIKNRNKLYDDYGMPEFKSYLDISGLKLLAFRLSFINGYVYTRDMLEKLNLNNDDLFILWGSQNSGMYMLNDKLKKKDVSCLITEYGELPGTITLNKDGIFGDSTLAKNWSVINAEKRNYASVDYAKKYLDKIKLLQSSSRGNSNDDDMLSIYRVLFQDAKSEKKVIYVSGVELLASGHLFDKRLTSPVIPNANEMLLKHVLSHFSSDEYIIFYKDHPLMQINYSELALDKAGFQGVIFVNSLNVDNLISMADMIITLPSKVAMTCLMYRKPVYVYGDFSIPETVPALGYYTGRNVAEIKQVVDDGCNIDPDLYPELVNKLLNEHLVQIEGPLFDSYDFLVEQQKVDRIIDDQLTIG